MDNMEFMRRCQQRRTEVANSTAEARARTGLYNIKLCELRDAHACLMRCPPVDMVGITRRALRLDVQDGLAQLHTNALGITFYKYFQVTESNKKTSQCQ